MLLNRGSLIGTAMLALLIVPAGAVSADPILFGPTPYLSASDSPFNGIASSYSYLEDFEDGLNTPGVTASGGFVIGNDPYIDAVDGDNGYIDGVGGRSSHSWYGAGLQSVTFAFNALTLGMLPTHVGIVWTDIGWNAPTPYYGPVSFEAFGPGGGSLGVLGSFLFGDGMDTGQTAEDRFLGVFDPRGIAAIRISTNNGDWEADHLQYGAAAVPEPSTLLLLGLGAFGAVRSRRRARMQSPAC
jgi:hypothetical protein